MVFIKAKCLLLSKADFNSYRAAPFILPHPTDPASQNSPTPPVPPPPRLGRCLSALMLIISAEWIGGFPWMSAEPLACVVTPLFLLSLHLPPPLSPLPPSMGIKSEGAVLERVRVGALPGPEMLSHAAALSVSPCQSALSPFQKKREKVPLNAAVASMVSPHVLKTAASLFAGCAATDGLHEGKR